MNLDCPYCSAATENPSGERKVHAFGGFRRKSDGCVVRRFRCTQCKRTFSEATGDPCFGQNKRQYNYAVWVELSSGVSLRRLARNLRLARTTIARKLEFLGEQSRLRLEEWNKGFPLVQVVEFDDLETFEHTKCKPLSVTLAVESQTRRILSIQVSQMPASGLLAEISRKKYGARADERPLGRDKLMQDLLPLIEPKAIIKSDQNPHYPPHVKKHFPAADHIQFKGRRGSSTGQGELKKGWFDPLFSLNHTCAMLRANINRLFRRTWCTTKKPARLKDHLMIYAHFHNEKLLKPRPAA